MHKACLIDRGKKEHSVLQVRPVVAVQKQVLFCTDSPPFNSFGSFIYGLETCTDAPFLTYYLFVF